MINLTRLSVQELANIIKSLKNKGYTLEEIENLCYMEV